MKSDIQIGHSMKFNRSKMEDHKNEDNTVPNSVESSSTKKNIPEEKENVGTTSSRSNIRQLEIDTEETPKSNDDDWQRCSIETSSETDIDSESSNTCEYDIVLPLKLLHKENKQASSTSPKENTEKRSSKINTQEEQIENEDYCIVLSDSFENVSETIVKDKGKEQQQEINAPNEPHKSTKLCKNKKKFKLFTETFNDGNPSCEEESTQLEKPRKEIKIMSTNNEIQKNNVNKISACSLPREHRDTHSDGDIEDIVFSRKNREQLTQTYKKPKLLSNNEKLDVELSLALSPRNCPQRPSSSRELQYCRHACKCNAPRSPESPKLRRKKKILQHMLHKREKKKKMELVKKVKKAICQALDTLESSSDEDSENISSDDETYETERLRKTHKQKKNSTTGMREVDPSINSKLREMEREVQYWKNIGLQKLQSRVISPEETRKRELEKELRYWKTVASSQTGKVQDSKFTVPHTSTPLHINHQQELRDRRQTSHAKRISRASSIDSFVSKDFNDLERIQELPADTEMQPTQRDVPVNFSRLIPHERSSFRPISVIGEQHKNFPNAQNEGHRKKYKNAPSDKNESIANIENFSGSKRSASADQMSSSAGVPSHPTCVVSRLMFSEKEKMQIIKYIVDNYRRLDGIKGKSFWVQMTHDLDTHRSWHSVKNNFFKNIIKNLEKYDMPTNVRNRLITLTKEYM